MNYKNIKLLDRVVVKSMLSVSKNQIYFLGTIVGINIVESIRYPFILKDGTTTMVWKTTSTKSIIEVYRSSLFENRFQTNYLILLDNGEFKNITEEWLTGYGINRKHIPAIKEIELPDFIKEEE